MKFFTIIALLAVSSANADDCCGVTTGSACPEGYVKTSFDTSTVQACCTSAETDGSVHDEMNMCDGSANPASVGTTSTNGDTTQAPVIDGCCGTFTDTCPAEKVIVADTLVEGEEVKVCCDLGENQELFPMDIQGCETGAPFATITTPGGVATASDAPVNADGCCTTTVECTSPKVKVGFNPMVSVCCEANGDISELKVADLNTCTGTVSTAGAGDCCGIKSSDTCPESYVYVDEFDTMYNGVEYTACCAGGNSDGSAYDDINMCDGSVNPKTQGAVDCCGIMSSGTCPEGLLYVDEFDTVINGVEYTACCADGNADGSAYDAINMCDVTVTTTAANPDGCCTTNAECTPPKVKMGFNPMVNVCCESDGNISELVVADLNTCSTTADTTTPSSADVAKAAVGMVVAAVATLQVVM